MVTSPSSTFILLTVFEEILEEHFYVRLIGVKLPEYGHDWEGNPAAFLSINLVENKPFEGFYGSSRHVGVE